MKRDSACFAPGRRFSCRWGFPFLPVACLWWFVALDGADAQSSGEKTIVQSAEASEVVEIVRSRTTGVITEMFISEGQQVKKGQVLGHTYLDDAKYKLDQARLVWKSRAPLRALEAQADAWTVTREETKDAVRKRKVADSRLDWATNMERFHRSNYEARLEQHEINRLHVTYWEQQYENCFFTAPADGTVTVLKKGVGDSVGIAAHVCTIINPRSFVIPVPVSSDLARLVSVGSEVPLRTSHSKVLANGKVERIERNPDDPDGRIIHLLLDQEQVSSSGITGVAGTTFDVLLAHQGSQRPAGGHSM